MENKIIIHSSPFDLSKKTQVSTDQVRLSKALYDVSIDPKKYTIYVNDKIVEDLEIDLKAKDIVIVKPALEGGGSGGKSKSIIQAVVGVALIAASFVPGVGAATASYLFAAGASLTLGGIAGYLSSSNANRNALADVNGSQKAESPQYSLNSGSNRARPFQPVPLVLGEMRTYPDICSQPYNDYINTGSSTITSYVEQLDYDPETYPTSTEFGAWVAKPVNWGVSFGSGYPYTIHINDALNFWTNIELPLESTVYITSSISPSSPAAYYAQFNNAQNKGYLDYTNFFSSYRWQNPNGTYYTKNLFVYLSDPTDPNFGFYVRWNKFVQWKFSGFSGAFFSSIVLNVDKFQSAPSDYWYNLVPVFSTETPFRQRLHQVFNFGLGDLTISNEKIGQTDLIDYRGVTTVPHNEGDTSWPLSAADPETSVVVVDGATCFNNANYPYPNNFVERSGPQNTDRIEVDISLRAFKQGASGIEGTIIDFDVEYKLKSAGTWTAWPLAGAPIPLSWNGINYVLASETLDVIGVTMFINVTPGEYEVRVRKRSQDPTTTDEVLDLIFVSVKFFRVDNTSYLAQNRRGLIIDASGQLNGALQRYSAVTKSKCWVYSGPAVWDGTTPESNTGSWTWTYSQNPADWFLYFSRGGFYNNSWTSVTATTPTIGWANGVQPNNKDRIFGVGLKNTRIDYAALISWRNFCAAEGLIFSATVDTQKSCSQVLNDIANVGRASPTWAHGKLGVIWESPNDYATPVALFSDAKIIKDSFSISYVSEKLPEQVILNFNDPTKEYNQETVRALRPDIINPQIDLTIDGWGIIDKTQAQREANILAARQLLNRRTVNFDVDSLLVERGDVVLVSHSLVSWGFSGRCIGFDESGGLITKIFTDCDLPTGMTSVRLALPDESFLDFNITIGNKEMVPTTSISASNFSNYLDRNGTINTFSNYPGTQPEDIIWLANNGPQYAKPMRIIDIKPKGENRFGLTLRDEEPAIYAYEYNNIPAPITLPAAQDYTKQIAKAFNVNVEMLGGGRVRVSWQTEGSLGVTLSASINGGLFFPVVANGGVSQFQNFVELSYTSGDTVEINVNPFYIGSPYSQVSDQIIFTVVDT